MTHIPDFFKKTHLPSDRSNNPTSLSSVIYQFAKNNECVRLQLHLSVKGEVDKEVRFNLSTTGATTCARYDNPTEKEVDDLLKYYFDSTENKLLFIHLRGGDSGPGYGDIKLTDNEFRLKVTDETDFARRRAEKKDGSVAEKIETLIFELNERLIIDKTPPTPIVTTSI
jgi:hypothetical protein